MIDAVGNTVLMLAEADPTTKAELYASLGITLTYDHDRRAVTAEAQPLSHVRKNTCRRGDLNPHVLSDTRPST